MKYRQGSKLKIGDIIDDKGKIGKVIGRTLDWASIIFIPLNYNMGYTGLLNYMSINVYDIESGEFLYEIDLNLADSVRTYQIVRILDKEEVMKLQLLL